MDLKEGKLVMCIGGGFFGARAARVGKEKGAKVVVIDEKEECAVREFCDEVAISTDVEKVIGASSNVTLLIGDGVEVLRNILEKKVPDWIVPAIPGHLIGKLTKRWLQYKGIEVKENSFLLDEVSKGIPERLIFKKNEKEGALISSFMPFGGICKIGCEQPMKCPVTGIEKPAKMYELLRFALSCSSIEHYRILISKQIDKGGVGAIKGEDVVEALKYFEENLKDSESIAIGTSCSCHAILNFFSRSSQHNNF